MSPHVVFFRLRCALSYPLVVLQKGEGEAHTPHMGHVGWLSRARLLLVPGPPRWWSVDRKPSRQCGACGSWGLWRGAPLWATEFCACTKKWSSWCGHASHVGRDGLLRHKGAPQGGEGRILQRWGDGNARAACPRWLWWRPKGPMAWVRRRRGRGAGGSGRRGGLPFLHRWLRTWLRACCCGLATPQGLRGVGNSQERGSRG